MIELCANGEKTLERFRYQFPDDWLYSDQLRGEWSAYNEILKRKNDSIQEQLGALWLCRAFSSSLIIMLPSWSPAEDCCGGQDCGEQNWGYSSRVGTNASCPREHACRHCHEYHQCIRR